MVPTVANLRWDVPIPDDLGPPYAPQGIVEEFVGALRENGLIVSDPEDDEYCYYFDCLTVHLRMQCRIGLLAGPQWRNEWLIECSPWRGFIDWLIGRRWDEEQREFVERVDLVLRRDSRVTELRWCTLKEWSAPLRQ